MMAAEAHRLGVLEEVHADSELVRIGLIGTEKIELKILTQRRKNVESNWDFSVSD